MTIQPFNESRFESENRSGSLWKCLERKEDQWGGYIYLFRLKEEYDDVTPHKDLKARHLAAEEKLKEIFPAVEVTGSFIVNYLKSVDFAPLGVNAGCGKEGVYLLLPDREALLGRWEKLREINPRLPKLDILESQGKASDRQFIEAFLRYDALISSGEEFVHDELIHVLPKLNALLSDPYNYESDRDFMRNIIGKQHRRIQAEKENSLELQELEASLSAFVDSIPNGGASYEAREYVGEVENLGFENMWNLPYWKEYAIKRFGTIDTDKLTALRKKIAASS